MNKITLGFFLAKSKTTIKTLLVLFALLLMNTQASWGQTPVPMSSQAGMAYTENFADISNWTANFASGIGASRWASYPITAGGTANDGKRTTKSSATFSLTTAGGVQKGTGNLVFLSTGSGTTSEAVAVDLLLDYTGVLAGTLSFNWAAIDNGSGTRPTSLRVYWSTDNTTFTEITTAQIIDIQSVNSGSITNISLPTNFNNSATARLRFYNHAGMVTGTGNRDKISIDDLVVTALAPTTTTWNGVTWTYGTPSASIEAIIDGTYSTTANGVFTAKKLTVNSGKSLTINTGTSVTVQNEVINNGSLVVENNANLIQVNNVANTGAVTVKRSSNPLYRLDYTLWSSPVVGTQTLANFSSLTSQSPTSRFYIYDNTQGATGLYSSVLPTTTFATGSGYLIRMPNEDPANLGTSSDYYLGTSTLTYNGVFTGTPNNGIVTLNSLIYDKYYAVGNPYPSTISAQLFLDGNSTDGVLYFWRKTNAATGSAYATFTSGGATTTTNSSAAPDGTIAVGQGFIVKTGAAATTLNFTNTMRTGNNSAQFFKTKKVVEKDRVWLNLTNTKGVFSQALVAYIADASQGIDIYDGKYINDSPIALTSNINNEEYTIQGRPAFDASDVVPLNFKTDKAGDYTIAIDHTDGLFATGQDVYLVDSTTGTETNLKTDSYTFTASAGVANARFSLKYQKTLKVDAVAFGDSSVTVYKNNGTLYVNSGASAISNIKVYDIQGRLIAEQKNVKANTASINNLKANQALIVQVISEDNKVVNKKVVN